MEIQPRKKQLKKRLSKNSNLSIWLIEILKILIILLIEIECQIFLENWLKMIKKLINLDLKSAQD
jgi:hypothetical protein